MKNNFIELTTVEKTKVFINLDNVAQIIQHPTNNFTSIVMNCSFGQGVLTIQVSQPYDVIKKLIEAQI